jgi:hypothetical protein
MCRWWRSSLRITAGVPPLTRISSLRVSKSFLLACLSRPSSGDLWCLRLPATRWWHQWFLVKHSGASLTLWVDVADSESDLWGLLELAFSWRWRLTPNSSRSKVRFNPDELNLWFPVSSLPKASPPRVGVGVNLPSLLLPCFAKRLARNIAAQPITVDARQFYMQACQFWDVVAFLGA